MKRTSSRQEAYRARSRASLIRAAQEVLAEVGLSATIEGIAIHAEVSPATIYNHFGNKEAYLAEALNELWNEWLLWAYDGRPVGVDFETMLDVCRRLFRIDKQSALLAMVLKKTLGNTMFVLEALVAESASAFKGVLQESGPELGDYESRFEMWAFCVAGIFQGLFVSEKFSPDDADRALRVSLAIWGLNPSEALRVTSRPISI